MEEQPWASWFRFLIAALATWRLSFLVARESGPWGLFARVRKVAGRIALGRALECVKCMSIWFAAPLAFFVGGSPWQMLVVWLALSGVAALIDECTRPPFEWKEESQDGLLRRDPDRSADTAAPDEN